MRKILIDTDIGDDIDDTLALAYALNSNELELIGVSTVFCNTTLRAKLALRLLQEFGRLDIPVAAGIGQPLIAPGDTARIPCQWDSRYDGIAPNCARHAVPFLLDMLRQNPDALLLPIGPLTNIAVAARMDPALMENVPIVMMGGMADQYYAEWNIACDPEAAAIVFSTCKNITMVGLDVTLQCRLTQEEVDAIHTAPAGESGLLAELIDRWMESSRHLPILHDPLAVAAVEIPELLTLEDRRLNVILDGAGRGVTANIQDVFFRSPQKTNIRAAVSVDSRRFVDAFLKNVFHIA